MPEPAVLSAEEAFSFDNTYVRELDGFYAPVEAAPASAPAMLRFNKALAIELGLVPGLVDSASGAAVLAGNVVPNGAQPVALAYAGHQFGGFSPQLGDGRALLLGELIDRHGQRRDLQLKGSGQTPFSRRGDGKAALGPVLREYLMGEAMHALGIPTTRALAAVQTGDPVFRETALPGAVLARVAASHIRVGTFQFFAARGENTKVKQLADYVIQRHYPYLQDADKPYLALLAAVRDAQASLVAQWMHVGFIHGVMNTDNMTVSGETIDYGPCAFMDRFDPKTVYSSIDTHGRYAYANQPVIAQWNLARLAETLLPLIDEDDDRAIELATAVIEAFSPNYEATWLKGMRVKLGLAGDAAQDLILVNDWLALLQATQTDYTQAMRMLADAAEQNDEPLKAICSAHEALEKWLGRWRDRIGSGADTATAMRLVNPIYIPRNHLVEQALEAAHANDYAPFDTLLHAVTHPFDESAGTSAYAQPAPLDSGPYQTFCGT
ncbi:MAG: YdiU family protein [Burkholderiaceae bacterium]